MKRLAGSGIILLVVILSIALVLRIRYGGGTHYQDVSTTPLISNDSLEVVFSFDEPIGNIAVSKDNRIFFTVHPESWPDKNKVMEVVDGKAVPFPNQAYQSESYQTVLGITVDNQNRLWTIDHGFHGFGEVKIMSFDLNTNQLVYSHIFENDIAEKGSFFNDLQVSTDGRFVYIADFSFVRKNPALVVHNTHTKASVRFLENHSSVTAKDYIIQTDQKDMVILGVVALKPGIDGIVVDTKGEYVYYGAMAHDSLYRVPTKFLNDFNEKTISKYVENRGVKPLNDGLSIDTANNVYMADVEHNGIARMTSNGKLETLIKDKRIRWADGLSFGGDGYLYFNDSAMPDQLMRSQSHIKESAPYHIFRFKTGFGGNPGR